MGVDNPALFLGSWDGESEFWTSTGHLKYASKKSRFDFKNPSSSTFTDRSLFRWSEGIETTHWDMEVMNFAASPPLRLIAGSFIASLIKAFGSVPPSSRESSL